MTTEVLAPVEGPSAWYGPDMVARSDEWLYELSEEEVAEIDAAVAALMASDTDLLDVDRESFGLPTLAKELRDSVEIRYLSPEGQLEVQ